MKEANALAHPLQGLSLVEASAGTGKTFLLVQLYLRALLVEGLSVEKVLAVTYTRAATGELSVRIRKALVEAREQLSDPLFPRKRESSDFLYELFKCVGNDRDLLLKRAQAALATFDEKGVFTMHGFCQRTLADHAFEAGAAFATEQIEDEDLLREEIVADFWRRRTGGDASPTHVRWLFTTLHAPRNLLQTLRDPLMVGTTLQVQPLASSEEAKEAEAAFERATESARQAWIKDRAELDSWLRDSDDLNRTLYNKKTTARLLEEWERWLAFPDVVLPTNFARLTRAKAETSLKAGAVPDKPFFKRRLGDALQEAANELRRLWWQETVTAALAFLRRELRARKRQLRERGFDDMPGDLRDALAGASGTTLARRIARQYPLILVDEFQDTDPLQHEIFTAIHAAEKGHGLVLIGDPKQAIYRFRGADVFTYLQARKLCAQTDRLFSLTRNYRSAEPLLTAVNELFGGASDPFEYAEIPYLPVSSGCEPPITTLTMSQQTDVLTTIVWDARAGVTVTKNDAAVQAARICADEIARLLRLGAVGEASVDAQPLQAKDIAVLVNKNAQGFLVQDALRRRGIAAAMVATQSVFASEEAEELGTVLAAIAEPADGRLLRRALATRMLGVVAAELAPLAQNEARWGETVGRFRGYCELWQNDGVAVMLARLFRDEGVIARTLARDDGERAMTNFRHLAELIGAEAARRPGIAPLLAWFAAARDEDAQQESRQLRLESDENLARIATIHKAKGLQYPVVFLPFLWDGKKSTGQSDPAVLAHDDAYRAVLDLGSDELAERQSAAEREQRAEDVRKTYVALTRAVRACYVIALPVNQVEASALGRLLQVSDANDFHAGLNRWVGRAPAAIELRAAAKGINARMENLVRDRGEARDFPFPERLRQRFHVASYSLLAAGAGGGAAEAPDWDETVAAVPTAETVTGIHGFPAGAASGTFLHAVIEALDFDADEAAISKQVQKQLAAHGIEAHWEKMLTPWLGELFLTPLGEPGCRLADISRSYRRDEMEFHFLMSRVEATKLNEVVSGFAPKVARPALRFDDVAGQMKGYLDLVFEHDGRFWIADYKSNRLGSDLAAYTPAALDHAMAEHRYDLQYLIYTVAVHRYLETRIADYDYEKHFGGVLYLFLRGMGPDAPAPRGVWHTRPAFADIRRLDTYFAGTKR